jgi:hypothetical protein
LNQFRVYVQKVSNKTEKGKIVLTKKIEKAVGQHFGPRLKPAHDPVPLSLNRYLFSFFSLADRWTPPAMSLPTSL